MMTLMGLLFLLGVIGGFFSGYLGLGGSILMIPLLLFVPPLFGFPALSMRVVAAISMVQVFFASLAAVVVHWKNSFVNRDLVLYMGLTAVFTGFAGAWVSRMVDSRGLEIIFAVISSVAAVLMFIPKKNVDQEVAAQEVRFNRPLAVLLAAVVGFIGGMVGAPGAFIYVPLLIYILGVPTRVTIGTTLAVVLLGSVAGLVGKVVTDQVPFLEAAALVIGAVPGAQIGGRMSKKTNPAVLRWAVTAVVVLSTLQVWTQVI